MNSRAARPFEDNLLDAEAAEWLAQREMGFSPEQESEFLRWRLADPRHEEALVRLEETSALLEQLPALRDDPRLASPAARPMPALAPSGHDWRKWAGAAAGLAALIALAAIAWWSRPAGTPAPSRTFATAPNGYQRVLLPDSSIAQLNGATALKVDYTSAERRVALAEGEAHFSVAKDIGRPFVVQARRVRLHAIGTAFNVRLTGNGVDVLVTEGVVRVERLDEPATPTVLAANERTVVPDRAGLAAGTTPANPIIERVEPAAVRAALAWQQPRFVFVESPLGEVVARFNARSRVQLELGDPGLAARVVGGTFHPDDVETFVRLLESSGEIQADRSDPARIVLRRADSK
jgi:transmembrane sensor